jgi:hypothetical protein
MLPESIVEELKIHSQNLEKGYGSVYLPYG